MCPQSPDGPIVLILDYKRAAQALSLSEQALRDMVWKGRGPVVTVIGRRRFFAMSDLQEFVTSHRRPSLNISYASDSFLLEQRKRRFGRTLQRQQILHRAKQLNDLESQLTEMLDQDRISSAEAFSH
jgi:hypothetical protein